MFLRRFALLSSFLMLVTLPAMADTTYTYTGSQLSIFRSVSKGTLGNTVYGNGYPMGSYGLLSASVGFSRGNFRLHAFGENLADRHAITAISAPIPQYTVVRPRVIGIRASYDF